MLSPKSRRYPAGMRHRKDLHWIALALGIMLAAYLFGAFLGAF